jgi:drug/metabolite transporter (DMT)-like permease
MTATLPPYSAAKPLLGIGLLLGATLAFALADVAGKFLVSQYDVPLVMAVRYTIHTILILLFMLPSRGASLFHTQKTGLVILRSLSLTCSSLLMGSALQVMPLAETVAIINLIPFGVLLFAGPVLGERVQVHHWLAALVAFGGVIMIARPGNGLATIGILFSLAAAAVSVIYVLLSRFLTKTETTEALLFNVGMTGMLFFGAQIPWNLHGPTPGVKECVAWAAMGSLSLIGHFLLTAAYRQAPAALLQPFSYAHLLWATLLGFFIFGAFPSSYSFTGMVMIVIAGVGIAVFSYRHDRKV